MNALLNFICLINFKLNELDGYVGFIRFYLCELGLEAELFLKGKEVKYYDISDEVEVDLKAGTQGQAYLLNDQSQIVLHQFQLMSSLYVTVLTLFGVFSKDFPSQPKNFLLTSNGCNLI